MYRVKHPNQLASLDVFNTPEQALEFAKATKSDEDKYFLLQEVRELAPGDLIADSDMLSIMKSNAASFGVDEAHVEDFFNPVIDAETQQRTDLNEEFTLFMRDNADWWAEQQHLKLTGYTVVGESRVDYHPAG